MNTSNLEFHQGSFFFFTEDVEYEYDQSSAIIGCIEKILDDHNVELGCINTIFCSDVYLLELNREYLNHDFFTDIMTFSINSSPLVADLFISIDRVKENAQTLSLAVPVELARVIIHGILHLLGYDDKNSVDIRTMRDKESHYLELLANFQ